MTEDEYQAAIKQAAKEVGLPEIVKLPNPEVLAQIAAGFGIQAHPEAALKKAVSMYLHALAFFNKHNNLEVRDLADACEDYELASQLTRARIAFPFTKTFLLDPSKRKDEARRMLAKAGLKLSKARSVLENLRAEHRLANMRSFLRAKHIPVTWNDGKPLWLFGTPTKSDRGEAETKLNEDHKANCCVVRRKELDDRTEAIAMDHGWREEDAKSDWKANLANCTERRVDGKPVYHLPEIWLLKLIDWKKSLKSTGGAKSRETARAKKSSQTS